ncbi:MAG: nucleotidyltransferase domain-containing protein [Chloroflexota bacterium]
MNIVDDIKSRLTPLFQKHHIQKAILFGSFARGEQSRRSDIDLILLQETNKRFLDRYDDILLDLGCAIKGCAVWPLIYTPAEFQKMQERAFIRRACQEGIVLFEQETIQPEAA